MAGRYKPTHQKKKRRTRRKRSSFLRTTLVLCFCVVAFVFSAFLWREALRVSSQEQGSVSASGEAFRPQVGDPPYRVAIDAGHGGNDPGARGVVEEKDMTAATASVLLAWLEQDPNYIPLRTRDAFDQTATPAERAAAANAQAPQLLLSIHGNSAANGSSATGFECYPSVHILAPRRCRMQTNDSQNGEETFPVPKIKMPQPKSSGPPDRRNLREGKVLIFRIYIFV